MWLTSTNSTRNSDINSPRPRNVTKGLWTATSLHPLTSKLGKRHLLKQNTSVPLDLQGNYLTKTTVLTKSLPDLAPIQSAKPFTIESDASKFATGAVLRQKDRNGDWHPCGYISHSFTPTERNYEIYDRELLGIVRSLETWRHYLLGSTHPVMILSDHKNLTYFQTAQKLNR